MNVEQLIRSVVEAKRGVGEDASSVELTREAELALALATPNEIGSDLVSRVVIEGVAGVFETFLGLKVSTWDAEEISVRPVGPLNLPRSMGEGSTSKARKTRGRRFFDKPPERPL